MTANAKIDQRMSSWLSIGANVTGSFIRNNQVPGPNSGATILARAVQKGRSTYRINLMVNIT